MAVDEIRHKRIQKLLTQTAAAFYDRFKLSNRLRDVLLSQGVISRDEVNRMEAKNANPDDIGRIILDKVKAKGVPAFVNFCHVLCQEDIDQSYIVTEVWGLNTEDSIESQLDRMETTDECDSGPTGAEGGGQELWLFGKSKKDKSGAAKSSTSKPGNNDPERSRYPMQKRPRGKAIIINMYEFTNPSMNLPISAEDGETMRRLFYDLRFNVETYDNKTKEQLKTILEEERKGQQDKDKYDAFVMVVMSHGNKESVIDVNGSPINVMRELVEPFNRDNAPGLINKPKLFFIQACRGKREDIVRPLAPEEPALPPHLMADMLIYYCTFEGFKAYLPRDGSVFIREIDSIFRNRRSTDHLLEMVTEVTKNVDDEGVGEIKKQIPECRSTLKHRLYFLQ